MVRRGLEWFSGSVLVYILVAACSASGVMDEMMRQGDGDFFSGEEEGDKSIKNSGSNTTIEHSETGGTSSGSNGDMGGLIMDTMMDPVSNAHAAEDGERIVNLYRTTADRLKTPDGYYDTVLNTKCSFLVAEDGKERCLPPNQAVVAASTYFSDSGCTIPVAYAAQGICPEYAYRNQVDSSCSDGNSYRYTVYKVNSNLTVVYSGTPESCTAVSQSTLDALDFFSVTKLEATAFAEGTLVQGTVN